MSKYTTRTTRLTIDPAEDVAVTDQTHITIIDHDGDEIIAVMQEPNEITITPEMWPVMRSAIDQMMNWRRRPEDE